MCNTCSNYTGCCNNYTQTNTGSSGCARLGWNQRICRDSCGNIWVRQNASSCCQCCNRCSRNGCCNNGNATDTANGTTGNGYGCFTVCGRLYQGTTAQTTSATQTCTGNGDWYYARQYGGNSCGGCCGRRFGTDFTVTDAMQ